MSVTSLVFIVFVVSALVIYYLVPSKMQWMVLLAASIIFYVSAGTWRILYVMMTALSIYSATRWMDSISSKTKKYISEHKADMSKEEQKSYKAVSKKKRKWIMIAALLFNFGILCVFKYCHFAVDQMNGIIGLFGGNPINNSFSIIVPLGISFYTFQSTGYLIDVYWGNCKVQKNYFKVLLFTSFFPQITQGPISDYEQLSGQFFKAHAFAYNNYVQGFQRVIWGLFKKMVIANMIYVYVNDVFSHYYHYAGITVFIGALCYSVQIYADFSGYMDIMCGVCKMFDIELAENFIRPYFSKSIAEYWRRWHITLGEWFKKYIYYPIGVSKWNRELGKKCAQKFGKHVGNTLPASIALVAVWLTTGLWHGASWGYIAWGGVNGLFIIFSLWMEPVYAKTKTVLRINESTFIWKLFQVVRTFILVTFIKVLPEVGTLKEGLGFWKQIFTDHTVPASFAELLPFVTSKLDFLVILMGIALLFMTSMIQRKESLLVWFNRFAVPVRYAALIFLLTIIIVFGVAVDGTGGFMYAQF